MFDAVKARLRVAIVVAMAALVEPAAAQLADPASPVETPPLDEAVTENRPAVTISFYLEDMYVTARGVVVAGRAIDGSQMADRRIPRGRFLIVFSAENFGPGIAALTTILQTEEMRKLLEEGKPGLEARARPADDRAQVTCDSITDGRRDVPCLSGEWMHFYFGDYFDYQGHQ